VTYPLDTMAMPKTLRTALIWMLMLALPAQGLAAIAMQSTYVAYSSADGSEQSPSAHHPQAFSSSHHAQVSVHSGHHDDAAQQTDSNLCGLCAFCAGAVALTSVVVSHSPLQVGEPSLARLDRFVGFVADTPRRPPRLFLA
jgi:hypothetical protein